MLILDTDTLSVLQNQWDSLHARLTVRLERDDAADFATTVVSFQEQSVGWHAAILRAKKASRLLWAYDGLARMLESARHLEVLPFDGTAETRFGEVRPRVRRVATMDLRIAAIALSRGATLLTRNLRDFRQVPGLVVEDWSA